MEAINYLPFYDDRYKAMIRSKTVVLVNLFIFVHKLTLFGIIKSAYLLVSCTLTFDVHHF